MRLARVASIAAPAFSQESPVPNFAALECFLGKPHQGFRSRLDLPAQCR